MSSVSVDGLLLSDFRRATQSAPHRVAFVVTGGKGCGKSTALRSFLSGCYGYGENPSKITTDPPAVEIVYGDYSTPASSLAVKGSPLPTVQCLVLDDVNVWAQMRAICGEDSNSLANWPGHLVLSAPTLECVPRAVSSSFVLVEYPIVASHLYALRRIREAHPSVSRVAAHRLVGYLPRGTSTSELMALIQTAVAASRTSSGAATTTFEESFIEGTLKSKQSPQKSHASVHLPPSLASIRERMSLLLNQHLARFTDDEDGGGAVSRHSSSTTGILLSGVTGSGKTLITQILETAFPSVPFMRAGSFEFFAKYLGESEEKLREFFRQARRISPCVVILEDIDVLAQSRAESSEGSSVAKRILTALLCELDGVEDNSGVLVIGTTSAVGTIDAALLRQGRLETVFEVPSLTRVDIEDLLISKSDLLADVKFSRDEVVSQLVGKPLSNFNVQMRLLMESSFGVNE